MEKDIPPKIYVRDEEISLLHLDSEPIDHKYHEYISIPNIWHDATTYCPCIDSIEKGRVVILDVDLNVRTLEMRVDNKDLIIDYRRWWMRVVGDYRALYWTYLKDLIPFNPKALKKRHT